MTVCDLGVANDLQQAVGPHLDEWAEQNPGGAVLAFMREGEVQVRMAKTFKSAATARNKLKDVERAGSIIVELADHVLML